MRYERESMMMSQAFDVANALETAMAKQLKKSKSEKGNNNNILSEVNLNHQSLNIDRWRRAKSARGQQHHLRGPIPPIQHSSI